MAAAADFLSAVGCVGPIGQALADYLAADDLLALTSAIPGMINHQYYLWPIIPFLHRYFPQPLQILEICDGQRAFFSGLAVLEQAKRRHGQLPCGPTLVVSTQALPSVLAVLESHSFEMLSIVDWVSGIGCLQSQIWKPTNTQDVLSCLHAQGLVSPRGTIPFRAKYNGKSIPLDFTILGRLSPKVSAFSLRVIHTSENLFWTSVQTTLDTCILTRQRLLCLFPKSLMHDNVVHVLRRRITLTANAAVIHAKSRGYQLVRPPDKNVPEWQNARMFGDELTFQYVHKLTNAPDELLRQCFELLDVHQEGATKGGPTTFVYSHPPRLMSFLERSFHFGLKIGEVD